MLLLAAQIVLACSCAQPGPVAAEVKRAAAVFSGKVTELVPRKDEEHPRVAFEVSRVWKGSVAQTSSMRGTDSMCGFPFEVGRTYVVFAYAVEGSMSASICSLTREVTAKAPVPKALGAGKPPAPASAE